MTIQYIVYSMYTYICMFTYIFSYFPRTTSKVVIGRMPQVLGFLVFRIDRLIRTGPISGSLSADTRCGARTAGQHQRGRQQKRENMSK